MQPQVDGQLHVVTGLRLHGVIGFDDGAVHRHHVDALSVGAVEVFFQSLLQTGLTHIRIHGIALVLIRFPLFRGHFAGVAKNMGSVLGIILPFHAGFHLHSGDVQFQHSKPHIIAGILQKNIIGQLLCQAPKPQFIADADHGPGFLVGPVVGKPVIFPQPLQQPGGGNIGVDLHVAHVLLEISPPGGGIGIDGIGIGSLGGHGEMVIPGHAHAFRQGHKLINIVVPVIGVIQYKMVDDQVVAGPAAHQNVAVPVRQVPTGGLHTGQGGKGGHVIRGLAAGLHHLQLIELRGIEAHDQQQQQQHNANTESGYSLHVSPPIRSMARQTG